GRAGVAWGGDGGRGGFLRELPVAGPAAVGQQVRELAQRVGELVRTAGAAADRPEAERPRRPRRPGRPLVTGLRVVVAGPPGRAEAEGRTVSHGAPPQLSGSRAG